MARGFWTGLLHGGVLSAAALVALSLALPIPTEPPATDPGLARPTGTTTPAPQSDASTADQPGAGSGTTAGGDESPGAVPATTETAAPAGMAGRSVSESPAVDAAPPQDRSAPEPPPNAEAIEAEPLADEVPQMAGDNASSTGTQAVEPTPSAPSAPSVDLPVGSEFGRGGDVVPQMPTPLKVPQARLDQSEPPAVSAPAAEPAPVAVTGDNRRPDTEAQQGPLLAAPEAGGDGSDLVRPETMTLPVATAAPRMDGGGGQDDLPAGRSGTAPAPQDAPDRAAVAAAPVQNATAEAGSDGRSPATDAPTGNSDFAPALPSPGLDLSLPPDLSDLRSLERN